MYALHSFCPFVLPLLSRHSFLFGQWMSEEYRRKKKKCCWRRCFWHWMFIVAFDSILFILWFLLDVYKYHKPLLLLRGHHINERTHSVELGMCFKCEWLMKNFVLHTTFILSLVLTSVFSIRLKRTHNHGFNSRLTLQIISRPKGEQRNFVLSS